MKTLYQFNTPAGMEDWSIVNDSVMGGISKSALTPSNKDSGVVFSGQVSFKNGGGFASIRTLPRDFSLKGFDGISIRVKGDGKIYQFRLRTGPESGGVAYKQNFKTTPGVWQEINLPFDKFEASSRGRLLAHLGPPDPAQVSQIGFLIADKQEGLFSLTIDWIKVYNSAKD